jgi:hypothetical protein
MIIKYTITRPCNCNNKCAVDHIDYAFGTNVTPNMIRMLDDYLEDGKKHLPSRSVNSIFEEIMIEGYSNLEYNGFDDDKEFSNEDEDES